MTNSPEGGGSGSSNPPVPESETALQKFVRRYAFPDIESEELDRQKGTISTELRRLRVLLEKLLAQVTAMEEGLEEILKEGKYNELINLYRLLRGRISKLSLDPTSIESLQVKRTRKVREIEGVGRFFESNLAPKMNELNSRQNPGGVFCYKIERDELARIVPIKIDRDVLSLFAQFRGGHGLEDQKKYDKEKIWKEVIWLLIDNDLFVLNVCRKSGVGVVFLAAIDLKLTQNEFKRLKNRLEPTLDLEGSKKRWWRFGM